MMTPLCDSSRKQRYISRRDFWFNAGMGIGGIALIDLMSRNGLLAAEPAACLGSKGIKDSPYLPKPTHFKPRAKAVLHLFMSQTDVDRPGEEIPDAHPLVVAVGVASVARHPVEQHLGEAVWAEVSSVHQARAHCKQVSRDLSHGVV